MEIPIGPVAQPHHVMLILVCVTLVHVVLVLILILILIHVMLMLMLVIIVITPAVVAAVLDFVMVTTLATVISVSAHYSVKYTQGSL